MELNWTTAAFEDGFLAYEKGADIEHNPYSDNGMFEFAKAWADGWAAAARAPWNAAVAS